MRKYKKTLCIILIILAAAAAVYAGASRFSSVGPPKPFRILFAVPISEKGKIGVFNDTMQGLRRAEKHFNAQLKIFYTSPQTASLKTEFVNYTMLDHEIKANSYDLVVAHSEGFKFAMIALAPKHPEVKFAVIDDWLGDVYPNVMSVAFSLPEVGFISGAAAALFQQEAQLQNPLLSAEVEGDKCDYGWIGGLSIPSFMEVRHGFEEGVHFISPNAVVKSVSINSFSDSARAEREASKMYSNGAKVVMAYTGNAGAGVFRAASIFDKYAIGCDRDQDGEMPGFIVTSVIKRFDRAGYLVVSHAIANDFFGTQLLNLANGGIEYTGMYEIYKNLGRALPQEFRQKMFLVKTGIINGTIKIKYPDYYGGATWR